tara:strand:+ start:385 stop:735 length:351 start_codon:yes stop_codon:yes gene_type:complete
MNKKNLDKYIIDFNASINDTIIAMDKTSFRTLVVEKNKKIVGVVTEGDLLRSFVNGYSPNNSIFEIVKYDFKYVKKDNINKAKKIIKNNLILLLPILNNNMELIDIKTINDVLNNE